MIRRAQRPAHGAGAAAAASAAVMALGEVLRALNSVAGPKPKERAPTFRTQRH